MLPNPRKTYLDACRAHLGVIEEPPGSNNTDCGRWYGLNPAAWCAMWVSHCAARANPLISQVVGKFAYTPTFAKWYDRQGRFTHGTRGIQSGDTVFFAFYGPTYQGRWLGIHHVGVVETVRANGDLVTLEGNTDNRSKRMVRSPRGVAGYGRPNWQSITGGGTVADKTYCFLKVHTEQTEDGTETPEYKALLADLKAVADKHNKAVVWESTSWLSSREMPRRV